MHTSGHPSLHFQVSPEPHKWRPLDHHSVLGIHTPVIWDREEASLGPCGPRILALVFGGLGYLWHDSKEKRRHGLQGSVSLGRWGN